MTSSYPGVKLSSINGHLICGLCGGYLIDATVLTECVHVFCRSCILKYLLEHKVCPLCQSLIQETRPGQALRPDVALQRIVYKLVPGLLKTEMKRISEFKELNLKEPSCTDKILCTKEIFPRNCNTNSTTCYSISDLCSSPLPTALATRSLSKSPCGLVSSTHATQMFVSNRLPTSAAFLVADDEFVSLALIHLTSLPSYSKISESIMLNETVSCIKNHMLDFDICDCCIIRLTNGRCQQTDLLNVFHSQVYPDVYICKLCFGLLHNPYLCDIPQIPNELENKMIFTNEQFEKYVLLYLYKEIIESHYQYTAYQLRVTEPINIMLREQFLWDELISMSLTHVDTTLNSSTDEKLNNLPVTFTKNDINTLRSYAIPVKTAWKWIVEEKLSTLLKAPLIYSLRDDSELKLIKDNELNINNSNCDQESNIICINVEFSNSSIQSDYDVFLSYLGHSSLDSIRSWLVRLKSVKIPRKRSRFHFGKELKMNSKQALIENEQVPKELTNEIVSSKTLSYNENPAIFNPSSVINIGYTLPKSFHFSRGFLTELIPLLEETCLQSNYLKKLSANNYSCAFITSLKLFRSIPIYLAGRYVKLSRRLPQSPWIIGSQRKLDSSVEELITHLILPQFGANSQSCFITAGREDVDVRCLGLGRPFAIEISDYELLPSEIIQRWSVKNKLASECNENEPLDLLKLASFVNSATQDRVFIRDLQFVSSKSASAALKLGEMQKAKCYRAVCWCPQGGINTELLMKMLQYTTLLNQTNENVNHVDTIHWPPYKTDSMKYGKIYFGPLDINQLTPIRVLHRRPLLNRKRTIHHLCFMSYVDTITANIFEFDDFKSWSQLYPVDELFILEIRCEAGTYVKELVHGDLGRCKPSLASIFGRQLDILALDVIAVELDWPTRLTDPVFN
ncbi:unnamed protein product [Schistosoma turkestanicum]|nr:unnamed protein product [Schistosoma turkestanicum]